MRFINLLLVLALVSMSLLLACSGGDGSANEKVSTTATAVSKAYGARDAKAYIQACIDHERAISDRTIAVKAQTEGAKDDSARFRLLGEMAGAGAEAMAAYMDEAWQSEVQSKEPAAWKEYMAEKERLQAARLGQK